MPVRCRASSWAWRWHRPRWPACLPADAWRNGSGASASGHSPLGLCSPRVPLPEPQEIDDLQGHEELAGMAARLSQGALRAQPLIFKGRTVGVLLVLAPDGDPFDDETRELLDAFGEQAAVALANAHLF